MAIPIKYFGIDKFKNYAYQNGQVLNAYGSTNLADKRNVMLYTFDASDKAQQWRAMYAGKYGEHTLYWLNCELGGQKEPFALDRYTGELFNNADVFRSDNSSARDQLVYFTEEASTGALYIHLYDLLNSYDAPSKLVLTAAPNPNGVNGNNSPASLTQAGNVYWGELIEGNGAQQWIVEEVQQGAEPNFGVMVTDFPYDAYYLSDKNSSYPGAVAECVWYCKGRFFEVNGVSDCCKGNAYQWATNDLKNEDELDREVGNPDTITLRAKSVGVFGVSDKYPYGHVVFIEELSGTEVIYSHCNGVSFDGALKISNGEIEVPNIFFENAQDGRELHLNEYDFRHKYGSGLIAIIYKKDKT